MFSFGRHEIATRGTTCHLASYFLREEKNIEILGKDFIEKQSEARYKEEEEIQELEVYIPQCSDQCTCIPYAPSPWHVSELTLSRSIRYTMTAVLSS
jgi:hypothetical protein